jgi:hypothetical protein
LTGTSAAAARVASAVCAAIGCTRTVRNTLIADAVAASSAVSAATVARTAPIAADAAAVAHTAPIVAHAAAIVAHAAITHATRVPVAEVAGLLITAYVLPGVGLTILHRVATSGAAEFVGGTAVPVRSSAAVLRIVLPVAVPSGRLISWAVASVSVVDVLPIAVVYKVIVVIDGDVVVAAPARAAAPAAAPVLRQNLARL